MQVSSRGFSKCQCRCTPELPTVGKPRQPGLFSGHQHLPSRAGPTDSYSRHRTQASDSDSSTCTSTSTLPAWPSVDWRRQNIQVLFVDRTDTIRARLACGLFERVAEWNGFGRVLLCWSSGTHAAQAHGIDSVGLLAALTGYALQLDILPRYFTRVPDQFVREDLDRYDFVITLDRSVRAQVLSLLEGEEEEHVSHYAAKVLLLSMFGQWETDNILKRVGGLALLPSQMSSLLGPPDSLAAARAVVDVATPRLASEDGADQFGATVRALIVHTAGLCKYLMDAHPGEDGCDTDA